MHSRFLILMLGFALSTATLVARNPPFLTNQAIEAKITAEMESRRTPAAAADIIASFRLLVRMFKGEISLAESDGLRAIAGPDTLDIAGGTLLRGGTLVVRRDEAMIGQAVLSVLRNEAPSTGIASVDETLKQQLALSRQISYQAAMHAIMRDSLATGNVLPDLPLIWWNNLVRPEWNDGLFLPLSRAALFPFIIQSYEEQLLAAFVRETKARLQANPTDNGDWAIALLKTGSPETEPWTKVWKSYPEENDEQRQAWREFFKAQERAIFRWGEKFLARVVAPINDTQVLWRLFNVNGLREGNHPEIIFRKFLQRTTSVPEMVAWLDCELQDTAFLRYAGAIGDPAADPQQSGTRENMPEFPSEFRFQKLFINAWRTAVHSRRISKHPTAENFVMQFVSQLLKPSGRRFLNFKLATLIYQLHDGIQRGLFSPEELRAFQKPLHELILLINVRTDANSIGHYAWVPETAGQLAYLIDKAIQVGRGWDKMEARHIDEMIGILASESANPFERSAAFSTLLRKVPAMVDTIMNTAELIHNNGIQIPADFLTAIHECALGIAKARGATPEIRLAD